MLITLRSRVRVPAEPFFPFCFLQTETADSESPPGEESNGTTAARFQEVDGNQYLIIDNLPSQNTATCRIEEPPDPTINENPIIFVHDQPDENFELESVKTELEEGQRRFWEPGRSPWIADDYESGIISVIWNVLTEIQNDSQTVGIILKKDNEGGLTWMNEDDFRARYAERILQNENDIRTLYYILNVILDEIGEELLIQTFSNSINLDPVCWFYWRVSPQNLQIVPYTDIGGFIDKTRNLRNSFEVYHDKFLNMIQRMLENGQQQADFINCVVWRKPAENVERYCSKGSLVGVEGRIQTRSYDNQQGQRVYVTEVICDSVQFLETKAARERNQAQMQQQPQNNDNFYDMKTVELEKEFDNSLNTFDIMEDDIQF